MRTLLFLVLTLTYAHGQKLDSIGEQLLQDSNVVWLQEIYSDLELSSNFNHRSIAPEYYYNRLRNWNHLLKYFPSPSQNKTYNYSNGELTRLIWKSHQQNKLSVFKDTYLRQKLGPKELEELGNIT